nr:MAG: major capsid protein [Microvirus Sku14]
MKNVYNNMPSAKASVPVNTDDWSHANNLSFPMGAIVPAFCHKVPPKTSFTMSPKFALKLMPMVFPIQTPIKARLSVFTMPIRALWDKYPDWISSKNMPNHSKYTPPYLSKAFANSVRRFDKCFGTGSLLDYLGVPTTYDGIDSNYFGSLEPGSCLSSAPVLGHTAPVGAQCPSKFVGFSSTDFPNNSGTAYDQLDVYLGNTGLKADDIEAVFAYMADSNRNITTVLTGTASGGLSSLQLHFDNATSVTIVRGSHIFFCLQLKSEISTFIDQFSGSYAFSSKYSLYSFNSCPWYDPKLKTGLKLSDYPIRMYHAIYNAYIRNIRNNPLLDESGNSVFNQYTPYRDVDGDVYTNSNMTESEYEDYLSLKYSNWEYDKYSTAVPQPLQGNAPLVGLTTYAQEIATADGSTKMQLNSLLTDDDGKSYTVNYVSDEEGLKDVTYTEVQDLSEIGKPVNLYTAATSSGITIEDIRNVNAYTRYLERNMRSGYSYKEIIENRYDVNVRYDDLLMPQFIGGFTRDVNVNAVTQTVQTVPSGTTYDGCLGSQAGDSICYGATDANIRGYCDEESLIMVLITVTPLPVYSQHLPKWWLDRDVLDTPTPEFQNLGFQPILNSEIAPIQFYNNDKKNLGGTFGYQRPWYQYLGQVDVAHGDFRGPLRNFLLQRVFSGSPRLGKDFTVFHPDQVNDVFNVSEDTDKIFGQIRFDKFFVKLPINRNCVPRLE